MSNSVYSLTSSSSSSLAIVATLLFSASLLLFLFYRSPPVSQKAPKYISGNYPIVGAVRFWTARWDYFRNAMSQTKTGQFSYNIGPYPIVGLSGVEGRDAFFGSSALTTGDAYNVLFGAQPEVMHEGKNVVMQEGFLQHFSKRLNFMMRRDNFAKGLSRLVGDTKARLDELAASPTGITDPFDSIYDIVFQLTMRTVGCKEIAEDPILLKKTLKYFETVEQSATASTIIFPWAPSPAKIKRTYAGGRLYMIFKNIVDERKRTGRREDDPLQYLIDLGDDIGAILAFVTGALFAGQLNTGINAAYILVYLAVSPHWMREVRKEVESAASKYAIDTTAPLSEQLSYVPLEAWETEFPLLDLCLRDSIRLHLPGTGFRKNVGGKDVKVGGEVIPAEHYAAYHFADIHQNPDIYKNSMEWDPSRYLPDRAEDKKAPYGYLGWGVGRHPCLGMRFAQLESRLITAYFLAMFEYSLCYKDGSPRADVPKPNLNAHFAHKPTDKVYLKYRVRDGQQSKF